MSDYLPKNTLYKFYKIDGFKETFYYYHIKSWNRAGNQALEISNNEIRPIVSVLEPMDSSSRKIPQRINTSKLPKHFKKMLIEYILEDLEKDLEDF